MFDARRAGRRRGAALLVSVAAHAAVVGLWVTRPSPQATPATESVSVRIVPPSGALAFPRPGSAAGRPRLARAARASRAGASAGGRHRRPAPPAPAPRDVAPVEAESAVAGRGEEIPFSGASVAGVGGAAPTGFDTVRAGLVPQAELAPVDSLWLERHRGAIERALQLTMDQAGYPREARRRWLQGNALVAFTLRRDGSVADVRVVRSSGHAVLDRQAVEVVHAATPLPRPPVDQEVEIPFVYRIQLM